MNFEIEKKYLFFSNRKISLLRKAFLEGYGGLPTISKPVLLLCEALHRICNLCACVTQKPANMVRKIEQQRMLQETVDWFQSEKKKLLWTEATEA